MAEGTYTLNISCPDRVGIVAGVGTFLAKRNAWITEANHFADRASGRFFMRQMLLANSLEISSEAFEAEFRPIADEFDMEYRLTDNRIKKKVIVLVSKLGHCLADFLSRWKSGDYDVEIPCVISNHETMREMVEWYGVPFIPIPVSRETKSVAFEQMEEIFDRYSPDLIVLARYMQVFPEKVCRKYWGKVMNIHHSFLPSFIGAKPYHLAFDRGVKMTGATCHYITSDLDAGPIIEQCITRVAHVHTATDMVRIGRDAEVQALAQGITYHLEDRVFIRNNRTIVFYQ